MPPSLYTQQSRNVWRTWLLMSLFLIVIIALGWSLAYSYNDPDILYIAVIFSLGMNLVSYWRSDKITLAASHAIQITKQQYPDYWNAVENLCITAGLPMPKLYVIQDPAPNAFATGRNKEHAAIAVTSGLLKMMDKNELEGVLAHELSHIGNRDILLSTVVVVLVGFIALLSNFFLRLAFTPVTIRRGNRRSSASVGIGIVGLIFLILSPIAATLIQLAISRKREYLADASGALLTRYPEGLASALKKIEGYNLPMMHPNNATAHLYISNPFGPHKDKMGFFSRLFMTHPPIQDRINALLGKQTNNAAK